MTIASHGGYDTGSIPAQDMVRAPLDGVEYDDVNEYLSCIERSQVELVEFLDELRELERPVIVCFFGDHQPGFVEWLAGEAYGDGSQAESEDGTGAEQASKHLLASTSCRSATSHPTIEQRHGAAQGLEEPHVADTSLNYLGAILLRAAGCPSTSTSPSLCAMRDDIPAINLNGYQDAQGEWHWHGDAAEGSDAYRQLSMVEHANLFEKKSAPRTFRPQQLETERAGVLVAFVQPQKGWKRQCFQPSIFHGGPARIQPRTKGL